MNTINQIHSYTNLRNYQNKKNSNPNFQGKIGEKVVKEITTNKTVTVASILAMVGGFIGLSKDKVSDVFESFVDRIKGLQIENENLTLQLKQTKADATKKEQDAREEFVQNENRLRDSFSTYIKEKNAEIAEKDAKIAELQKYEGMAGVKSIEEIGVIMPDRAIEMIEEIKANNESAHKSLFEYIMTGKGQEEFLKQIARNEYLVKARKDGIEKIPSVSTAIEQAANDGIRVLGFFSYETACEMLGNCLKTFANGDYIQVPAIYRQVRDNANSLLLPLLKQDEHYPYKTVEKEMQDAIKFQNGIKDAKLALAQKGYNYLSETRRGVSPNESFMTFVDNQDGITRDYSLQTLSEGYNSFLGMYRLRDAKGNIIRDNSSIKD